MIKCLQFSLILLLIPQFYLTPFTPIKLLLDLSLATLIPLLVFLTLADTIKILTLYKQPISAKLQGTACNGQSATCFSI